MTSSRRFRRQYLTYVPTYAGFLYLAVVLDAFSRRVVGWAMSSSLKTGVVLDALQMAATQRRPTNVVHHSDQGSQYGALAFGHRCRELGVRPSMGSRGDAYDNAMAESFFATLECELLARRRFTSHAEARLAVFRYIEGWYNPHRRHSAIGRKSPNTYERRNYEDWVTPRSHCPRPPCPRLESQARIAPRNRGNSTQRRADPHHARAPHTRYA